ncbi:MAG: NADH-quinone oxidoreductase subunit H [Chlamydiae bacterium]|nr:NADH-quinone oxidoreductase subunit H [Chlamydiota bacterium]MBI3276318.1 NADH-quinone oxidoreductase subunit H [Chlamydiota bacterium]
MIDAIPVLLRFAIGLLFPPFLLGIIAKTKAFFAGRKGPRLLQVCYDILKLTRKGSVYSPTTTWIFRVAPLVFVAAMFVSTLLMPFGALKAPIQFYGDVLLFVGLFALTRFLMVLAALDTGSSFEGMGASREAAFSCLSEIALFLNLTVLVILSKNFSLSTLLGGYTRSSWINAGPSLILVVISFFMILLVENARIPIDDPDTHLELTMIHEVMILDHSGPDLAFILYGACLKLFVLGSFLASLLLPFRFHDDWINAAVFLGAMIGLAVVIGIVESSMARLRLNRVQSFITVAIVLASFALIIVLSRTL